jgi:Type IV secretion system pilin
MKSLKKLIVAALAFAPGAAFAQQIVDANSLTAKFTNIGNTVVTIVISFAVIWIIINVVRYLVVGAGDPTSRSTAAHAIIWGIVGLFVILSIWGLVKILTNTFKTDNNVPRQDFPTVVPPPQI